MAGAQEILDAIGELRELVLDLGTLVQRTADEGAVLYCPPTPHCQGGVTLRLHAQAYWKGDGKDRDRLYHALPQDAWYAYEGDGAFRGATVKAHNVWRSRALRERPAEVGYDPGPEDYDDVLPDEPAQEAQEPPQKPARPVAQPERRIEAPAQRAAAAGRQRVERREPLGMVPAGSTREDDAPPWLLALWDLMEAEGVRHAHIALYLRATPTREALEGWFAAHPDAALRDLIDEVVAARDGARV